ncbi:MAG: dethiobiotin synthase [Pirellulaceae bacterium]|nr:dethiobiotin synthase [Pirellulaceae bacterium]
MRAQLPRQSVKSAKKRPKPTLGLFITGTDTGVGKTRVAAAIARALVRHGWKVGVYKPAASGCERVDKKLVSEDAVALWEAACRPGTFAKVCPQLFAAPLAPHLAAEAEGKQLDEKLLRKGIDYWLERSDIVIVEGAGGLLSPLGEKKYVADLARAFGFPLVVVAPNRIGTINQTLQTLLAAQAYALEVSGIVLSDLRPLDALDPSVQSNPAELASRSSAPLLARLSYNGLELDTTVDWPALARPFKRRR